mgnify:CR=1 FL=1
MRPVPAGKSLRMSFSRQKEVLEMPNLIEIQKNSYQWFLDEGLKEVFEDISPIADFAGHLSLEFVDFTLCEDDVKYTIPECKERDATYAAPLKVKVRLHNKETDEINEHEIFMGDLPLMTETGTFVINGAERVIVSQLVRSPGVYYAVTMDPSGKKMYGTTVIPNRGAWIEYETDLNDVIYARVDRTRKLPATVLLRAMGLTQNEDILALFNNHPSVAATLERDTTTTREEALIEIYNNLNKENFINSPKKAFETLKYIIKEELHKNLLLSVSYDFCENSFSNSSFINGYDILYNKDGTPKEDIEKFKLGRYITKDKKPSENYLYEKAVWDSKIEEEVILEENRLIDDKTLEVFAKLPKFKIPTPYKDYEPDFAYLLKNKNNQKIFFVCETKGYDRESDIPEDEMQKINYAKKFFECLNNNLKREDIKVIYRTRINKENLIEVIQKAMAI